MSAPPIPMFRELILELQANCNRDCFFCPRHSDDSGHRKGPDGKHVLASMPTESIVKILQDAHDMGYRGWITFHHLSEPFLDPRLLDMARLARALGMKPFEHTNGDPIRNKPGLCREAQDVFEYVVVGLYDYKTAEQREIEKDFWRTRLGPEVRFSLVENMFVRGHHTEKNLEGLRHGRTRT